MFGPFGRRREWPRHLPLIGGGAPLGRINGSLWWRLRGQGSVMGFSSLGLALGCRVCVGRGWCMPWVGGWMWSHVVIITVLIHSAKIVVVFQ